MSGFVTVYDLRNDKSLHRIKSQPEFESKLGNVDGLEPESEEWWNAVAIGKIEETLIEGVIKRVYMSGHNDYPEFEILGIDNSVTSWTRSDNGTLRSRFRARRLYKTGNEVRLKYTLQPWKSEFRVPGLDKTIPYKMVTSIEIKQAKDT